MIEIPYYHGSVRRYVIAFGTIFNGINIVRANSTTQIPVPLKFLDKEKFVKRATELSRITQDDVKAKESLPMMGFDMISMVYAPQRHTNTIERIITNEKSMFNRVPYDITFSLYIGTRHYDDALRIVEQILPFFTPELNVRVKEDDLIGETSDIPIILDDVSPAIDASGDFQERRAILWTMTFTLQGYLYGAQKNIKLIKKAIVEMNSQDNQAFLEGFVADEDETIQLTKPYGADDAIIYHGASVIGDLV